MTDKVSRILVVDDQRGMRLTLQGVLADEGHDVTAVDTGYKAVEAARGQRFDLILLDVNMPGMDGVETIHKLREIVPDPVIVMMTGRGVDERVKSALNEGAHSALTKPFDVTKIFDVLESAAKGGTVLVVDDDGGHRESLNALLEEQGYFVTTAPDGADAVDKAAANHYDLILMDLRMPGKDGFTAFQEILRVDPDARVVFTTGSALDQTTRDAIETGDYPVAYKPFDVDEMLSLVKRLTIRPAS